MLESVTKSLCVTLDTFPYKICHRRPRFGANTKSLRLALARAIAPLLHHLPC
jgi:hypothetical protein